jgi:transposase
VRPRTRQAFDGAQPLSAGTPLRTVILVGLDARYSRWVTLTNSKISKRQRGAIARERERRAWVLYTEHGLTQAQIADELHVTKMSISRALKRAEALGVQELREKISAHKALQLARLESLYRLAMQSFQSSKGDHTIKTRSEKTGRDGSPEIVTRVQVVRKAGDARHLAEARGALADIRKLLGLDASTKIQVTDPERPDQDTSDEDLRKELAEIYRAAGLDPKGRTH